MFDVRFMAGLFFGFLIGAFVHYYWGESRKDGGKES